MTYVSTNYDELVSYILMYPRITNESPSPAVRSYCQTLPSILFAFRYDLQTEIHVWYSLMYATGACQKSAGLRFDDCLCDK